MVNKYVDKYWPTKVKNQYSMVFVRYTEKYIYKSKENTFIHSDVKDPSKSKFKYSLKICEKVSPTC